MYTCHIVALCTPHHHLQILVVQMVGLLKKTHIHFFWAQAHLFHPPGHFFYFLSRTIPRWTRCAAAMLVSGGPGRGDIAVVHVATLVAALLDIS